MTIESYRLNALATSLVQDCVRDMALALKGPDCELGVCMALNLGRLETMLELAAKYAPREEPDPDACEHCGAPPALQIGSWTPVQQLEAWEATMNRCNACGADRDAVLPRVSPPILRES